MDIELPEYCSQNSTEELPEYSEVEYNAKNSGSIAGIVFCILLFCASCLLIALIIK